MEQNQHFNLHLIARDNFSYKFFKASEESAQLFTVFTHLDMSRPSVESNIQGRNSSIVLLRGAIYGEGFYSKSGC